MTLLRYVLALSLLMFLQACATKTTTTTTTEIADAPAYQAPLTPKQDYIYRSPSPAAIRTLR